jgi:pilus assembly protein CpaB
MPLNISKNVMLLGGALVLGALCFVGANYYMRDYMAQVETRLAGSYKARKVMVAKIDVPAGGVLSEENLAVRSIPERYLASTSLTPGDLDMVRGQKAVVALQPGDPIDRAALERADRGALSTTLAVGQRAITFPVDEISSINGMLVPGDIIDLVYTGTGTTANSYRQAPSNDGAAKELMHVRPILQAVPVIATGKTTQKRVVRTESGEQREVDVAFSTVTLTVTPAQAEQVLLAQKLGALTAVLRNPDDKSVVHKSVLDEASFKQVADRPSRGRDGGHYIEMIIGGMGTPGGSRMRAQQPGDNPLAALLSVVQGTNSGAGARTGALPPEPVASDVRARLGVASDIPAASAVSSIPTKQ